MIETVVSETIIETIIESIDTEPSVIILSDDTPQVIITENEPGPQGVAGLSNISQADDIDITNLQDGSLIVYSTTSSKWIATKNLDQQAIDSGQY